MTRKELPAQAVNIKRALRSPTSCSSATVESLKSFLSIRRPTSLQETDNLKAPRISKAKPLPTQKVAPRARRDRKTAKVVVSKAALDEADELCIQEKWTLATETINIVLNALTDTIKNQARGRIDSRKLSAKLNPDLPVVNALLSTSPQPLQPISANCINSIAKESCRSRRSSSTISLHHLQGLKSQAECACVAFSALRTLEQEKGVNLEIPRLQLETGMSAFIGKLITLGFEDLATKELRILKRQLDGLVESPPRKEKPNPVEARMKSNNYPSLAGGETLANLLHYRTLTFDGSILALIITSQIQALKLISLKANVSIIETALQHLRLSNPYSPANLIERQVTEASTEFRCRAVRQLELLTNSMLALCSKVSIAADRSKSESYRSLSPLIIFDIQVLVLEIRSRGKNLSHECNYLKEISEPFALYLTWLRRRSSSALEEAYDIAKKAFEKLSVFLRADEKVLAVLSPPREHPLYTIYQLLADMAQEVHLYEEAVQWLQAGKILLRNSQASQTRVCESLCRIANLHIRAYSRGANTKTLLFSLKEASECLQGDLRGEATELDSLLFVVVALRRLTFSIIHESQKSPKDFELEDQKLVLDECTNLIILGVKFLIRYLGNRKICETDEKAVNRYDYRRKLVWNNVNPFFESLAAITRFSIATHMEDWKRVDIGLQHCIRLASGLNEFTSDGMTESNDQESKEIKMITLSNAYWCRYLYLKQNDGCPQEMRKSLRISIDIFKCHSPKEKLAGLLPMKLEKLGSLCESSRDYVTAARIYSEALQLHVDCGLLELVAKSSASRPLVEVLCGTGEHSILGRLLLAYPRAILKVDNQHSDASLFFDDKNLPLCERGVLLEQQLATVASLLITQGPTGRLCKTLGSLITSILKIYDPSHFPVRRLRLRLQLLQIYAAHPTAIEPEALDYVLVKEIPSWKERPGNYDLELNKFRSHLLESQEIYLALLCRDSDLETIERNLALWLTMIRESCDYNSLQHRVYDVERWILELEFIAGYLEMQGLDIQRLTALYIIAAVREAKGPAERCAMTLILSSLGSQYIRLGYPTEARQVLDKAMKFLAGPKPPFEAAIKWNLASAELAVASGCCPKGEEHLSKARALFEEEAESVKANRSKFKDRNSMIQMVLDANHIHSLISLAEGKFSRALLFARQYIKLNYRAWATLENHERKAADLLSNKKLAESDGDDTADQLSQLSILHSRNLPLLPNTRSILQSSSFWPLVHRLYRGLVHTSEIFAYGGLFPEAQYYMEQGQKIAAEISSSCLVSQSLGLLGNFQTRIGESEKGMVLMQQALDTRLSLHDDHHLVFLHLFMASNLNLQKKAPLAAEAFKSAENTIEQLIQSTPLKPLMDQSYDLNSLERQLNEFSLNEAPTGRRIRTSKAISVKGSIGKPTAVGKPLGSRQQILDATNSSFLWRIKSQCLRQQAEVAVHNKKTDKAASLLSEVEKLPSSPCDQILNVSSSGLLCLSQALESMAADPVFCVLPESTVAQPSIISVCSPPDGSSSERSCQNKTQISPPKKGAAKGSVRRTKQILPPSSDHSNLLRQAHDSLIGVLDQVKSACSVSSIHTTTDTLTRVLMMLSALTSAQEDIRFDSTFALYVMEVNRSVPMMRANLAIQIEQQLPIYDNYLDWPKVPEGDSWDSLESYTSNHILNPSKFQSQYVDIIPKSWTVLSLSLSRSHDEISISRVRSGQSPFILTLPMNRHNAQDSEDDCFGFENGKRELQEIINLSNRSAHDTRDMSIKGAKTEWWVTRIALETRLQELLHNMESIWLGGFRGIFSQTVQSPELLLRFQNSLQNILNKHLPSRQKSGRRKKPNFVELDLRVLELFICLGAVTELEDMDEQLMDLLYFVIDILQFHGERNAYDEIDFDLIAIEVIDALRQYHEFAKNNEVVDSNQHTILILDKELHCFPWESLPCMSGQAVSRLPSFGCLRDRILKQQEQKLAGDNWSYPTSSGFRVSRENGAAIINPAADLKETQAKFEPPVQRLSGWETIIKREPNEKEMKSILESRNIFLYFGHGSGAQYIRSRTIKKLSKCAVTLLMGCSSGALTEAGDFEPYGTPMNYLQAGCPALLATLWDVTDKDIDNFSYEVLEKWGLFSTCQSKETSIPTKRNERNKAVAAIQRGKAPENELMSLDQAVARARGSCKLRYLNGAAPVVYGIPVFLS